MNLYKIIIDENHNVLSYDYFQLNCLNLNDYYYKNYETIRWFVINNGYYYSSESRDIIIDIDRTFTNVNMIKYYNQIKMMILQDKRDETISNLFENIY